MTRLVDIVPATAAHAGHVAAHIRAADRAELAAMTTLEPSAAIAVSMRGGFESLAGLVDGEPVCVFGVGSRSALDGTGVPWLIGSDALERHAVPFLRRNRAIVARWLGLFDRLENWVHDEHAVSVRWLGWLGFTVHRPAPWGPFGNAFRRFEMPPFALVRR